MFANRKSGVRRYAGVFATVATLLIASCATTGTSALPDQTRAPTFGSVSLTAGFANDPHIAPIISGGPLNARRALGPACAGYVAVEPDYRLIYQAGGQPLSFTAISPGDVTLAVRTPGGDWLCDDDSGPGLNSFIGLQSPASGQYDVWVGSYWPDQFLQTILAISQNAEGPPSPSAGGVARGSGTGFFVSARGHVATSHHVVDGASSITVTVGDVSYDAKIVAIDPENDLAILETDARAAPLPLGSSVALRRAEEVFTLGYPLVNIQGSEQRASFGRINALSGQNNDPRYIQIDVPVQPGNSGGPLFGPSGAVVGVVSARLDDAAVFGATGALPENISFAVKVEHLIAILPDGVRAAAAPLTGPLEDRVEAAEDSVVIVSTEFTRARR